MPCHPLPVIFLLVAATYGDSTAKKKPVIPKDFTAKATCIFPPGELVIYQADSKSMRRADWNGENELLRANQTFKWAHLRPCTVTLGPHDSSLATDYFYWMENATYVKPGQGCDWWTFQKASGCFDKNGIPKEVVSNGGTTPFTLKFETFEPGLPQAFLFAPPHRCPQLPTL